MGRVRRARAPRREAFLKHDTAVVVLAVVCSLVVCRYAWRWCDAHPHPPPSRPFLKQIFRVLGEYLDDGIYILSFACSMASRFITKGFGLELPFEALCEALRPRG